MVGDRPPGPLLQPCRLPPATSSLPSPSMHALPELAGCRVAGAGTLEGNTGAQGGLPLLQWRARTFKVGRVLRAIHDTPGWEAFNSCLHFPP